MLERVAQGQTRFNTPGISVDGRGVALGRFGALHFASLDGVVGWLRVYSAEAGLEDLLADMQILRVRDRLKGRAFLVLVPAQTSYVLDRATRCARLWGGTGYTGTARHFVKYRDDASPYGWDVVGAVAGEGDFVLHGEDTSVAYTKEGTIDLRQLIFRLSLQRVSWAPLTYQLEPLSATIIPYFLSAALATDWSAAMNFCSASLICASSAGGMAFFWSRVQPSASRTALPLSVMPSRTRSL